MEVSSWLQEIKSKYSTRVLAIRRLKRTFGLNRGQNNEKALFLHKAPIIKLGQLAHLFTYVRQYF